MTDRGWYDDEYEDALQQANDATRVSWAVIAGTVGALSCALIALVALGLVVVAALLYAVVASHY